MTDQSQKSQLQIWKDLHNVTSSAELLDGQEHCKLQEYHQTSDYGQVHHPANHLAKLVNKKGSLTQDTSHQHSCASSGSASLQSFLESRLRKRLKMGGSTIFMLKWRNMVTTSGLPYCHLVSSVRRTNASDYTSGLLASWLTPTVTNIGARSPAAMQKRLNQRLATGRKSLSPGNLLEQVKMYWGTGTVQDSIYAEMVSTETLNPQFPCWLMGFPQQWDVCGVSAMQ